MVRVGISVEGVTEERFVKMVLSPYLSDRQVHVTAISVGGDIKLGRIRAELKKIAYSFDYVSTLYDFYGFKGKSSDDTKDKLEQKIRNSVHNSIQAKIIPYIQMHEFEGLLFSSPQAIANNLKDDGLVQWAESILAKFNANPEKINDSKENPPSRRLEGKTIYRKTTHGPDIAKEIGIETIRERCSGFDAWLKELEGLPHETAL